jgi:geranylgeranyl diphosphate synthase type I
LELPSIFLKYRTEIDFELKNVMDGFSSPFYDMLRYHLGWIDRNGNSTSLSSGKALRSTLCLLACEAITGDYKKALPAAAALELVHNFSLIHDDIQDDDRERRNRPTVWAVWGKPQAINAGTAMRVLANVSMMRLADRGVAARKLLQALTLLDETSLRLIEGQYLDLNFERRSDVGVNDYLAMVERKTVSLIACSVELGAMLVTDNQRIIKTFGNYGRNLGFAFQVMDDLLGIWGDEDKTGKPVGSDIQHKKKSFPIVYAWENSDERQRAELIDIYRNESIDEIELERVLALLELIQAKEATLKLVSQYCTKAMAEIDRIPICSWVRDTFQEMVQFLTVRDY